MKYFFFSFSFYRHNLAISEDRFLLRNFLDRLAYKRDLVSQHVKFKCRTRNQPSVGLINGEMMKE